MEAKQTSTSFKPGFSVCACSQFRAVKNIVYRGPCLRPQLGSGQASKNEATMSQYSRKPGRHTSSATQSLVLASLKHLQHNHKKCPLCKQLDIQRDALQVDFQKRENRDESMTVIKQKGIL